MEQDAATAAEAAEPDFGSRIKEVFGDDMRNEVIEIVLDALERQGYPTMTRQTVQQDEAHRRAFLAMLDDCRPLPVIQELKQDVRAGRPL